jgi:hypothetical protein
MPGAAAQWSSDQGKFKFQNPNFREHSTLKLQTQQVRVWLGTFHEPKGKNQTSNFKIQGKFNPQASNWRSRAGSPNVIRTADFEGWTLIIP